MTFAAIDWLSISINLLLVVFVIVCLLMTLLILMQRPKQEGLGAAFGGGVTDQVFGARTTNVLQRGTVYLGSMFFLLAIALAVLIGIKNQQTDLLKGDKPAVEESQDEVMAPEPSPVDEPALPKSLSDELPVAPDTEAEAPVNEISAPESSTDQPQQP